jgi:hypothetical protein
VAFLQNFHSKIHSASQIFRIFSRKNFSQTTNFFFADLRYFKIWNIFLVLSYFFSNIFYTFAPSKRTDYYPELSKGKLVENQEYKGEVMLKKH